MLVCRRNNNNKNDDGQVTCQFLAKNGGKVQHPGKSAGFLACKLVCLANPDEDISNEGRWVGVSCTRRQHVWENPPGVEWKRKKKRPGYSTIGPAPWLGIEPNSKTICCYPKTQHQIQPSMPRCQDAKMPRCQDTNISRNPPGWTPCTLWVMSHEMNDIETP